jgi:hypothetical protein
MPFRPLDPDSAKDADLAGPLFFCLALGFLLLLHGKVHFGYIYGFGLIGCILLYVILNLMLSGQQGISLDQTMSILGYSLVPTVVLAAINIFVNMTYVFAAVVCSWLLLTPLIHTHTHTYTHTHTRARAHRFLSPPFSGILGFCISSFSIAWSTLTATRLIEFSLQMREQRYLVAYPVVLMYACFTLLTVF